MRFAVRVECSTALLFHCNRIGTGRESLTPAESYFEAPASLVTSEFLGRALPFELEAASHSRLGSRCPYAYRRRC
jgi:hypothetical protein